MILLAGARELTQGRVVVEVMGNCACLMCAQKSREQSRLLVRRVWQDEGLLS